MQANPKHIYILYKITEIEFSSLNTNHEKKKENRKKPTPQYELEQINRSWQHT